MIGQLHALNTPIYMNRLNDMGNYYRLAVSNVMYVLTANGVKTTHEHLTDMLASGNFQYLVNGQELKHFKQFIEKVIAEYT